MTTYTAIPDENIEPGAPIRSVDVFKLRDNPIAITEGSSGAPKVQTAAIQDLAVTTAKLAAGAVTTAKIGTIAITQAQIATTLGNVSTGSGGTHITLPGGEYGWFPQIRAEGGGPGVSATLATALTATTYATVVFAGVDSPAGGRLIRYQQRYVSASPPYDLGDGDVEGFVFATVDGLGNVVSLYQAPDPPWAYNGPTTITPTEIDARGNKYRTRYKMLCDCETDDEVADLLAGKRGRKQRLPITKAFKNSDMHLIPHPFLGNDLSGLTVVMLDPMAKITRTVMQLMQDGEDTAGLFHGGRVRLDNEALKRATPEGVIAVAGRL